MNCPLCNHPDCEECAHEVDIGVGVQRHVFGYDCPKCGQMTVCNTCGAIGDDHAKWCDGVKGMFYCSPNQDNLL